MEHYADTKTAVQMLLWDSEAWYRILPVKSIYSVILLIAIYFTECREVSGPWHRNGSYHSIWCQ